MRTDVAEDIAVVIAAHGDRAGKAPNRTVLAHSSALAASGAFRHAGAGVLNGEPALETALALAAASGAAGIAVFPFFMSGGYFTGTVLPARIASAGMTAKCRLLAPLGLDPRLPGLMSDRALEAARSAGFRPGDTALLVAGHGSKLGPASARATLRIAEAVRQRATFARVSIALLEEPPFLGGALAAAIGPLVVTGFFSGDGLHAGEDVPEAIRASGRDAVYAGPVGGLPGVAGLIRDAVLGLEMG